MAIRFNLDLDPSVIGRNRRSREKREWEEEDRRRRMAREDEAAAYAAEEAARRAGADQRAIEAHNKALEEANRKAVLSDEQRNMAIELHNRQLEDYDRKSADSMTDRQRKDEEYTREQERRPQEDEIYWNKVGMLRLQQNEFRGGLEAFNKAREVAGLDPYMYVLPEPNGEGTIFGMPDGTEVVRDPEDMIMQLGMARENSALIGEANRMGRSRGAISPEQKKYAIAEGTRRLADLVGADPDTLSSMDKDLFEAAVAANISPTEFVKQNERFQFAPSPDYTKAKAQADMSQRQYQQLIDETFVPSKDKNRFPDKDALAARLLERNQAKENLEKIERERERQYSQPILAGLGGIQAAEGPQRSGIAISPAYEQQFIKEYDTNQNQMLDVDDEGLVEEVKVAERILSGKEPQLTAMALDRDPMAERKAKILLQLWDKTQKAKLQNQTGLGL